MLREDKHFHLPNLHTFQNNNVFYGSYRGLRFRVKTCQKVEEGQEPVQGMEALCWYGEYCLEESVVKDSAWFPMTEAGYEAVLNYLDAQYDWMMEQGPGNPAQA